MRARIWRDFFGAVIGAFRRPDEAALNAERRRGVDRLGRHVVEREEPGEDQQPER